MPSLPQVKKLRHSSSFFEPPSEKGKPWSHRRHFGTKTVLFIPHTGVAENSGLRPLCQMHFICPFLATPCDHLAPYLPPCHPYPITPGLLPTSAHKQTESGPHPVNPRRPIRPHTYLVSASGLPHLETDSLGVASQ